VAPWLCAASAPHRTLEAVAAHGKDIFYKGEIARAIVDVLQRHAAA